MDALYGAREFGVMRAVSLPRPLCGVVLAGGRSSRMGQDKAQLIVQAKSGSLLEKTVRLLLECTDQVIISCRRLKETDEAARLAAAGLCRRIPDRLKDCGPLGGIHAVLHAVRAPVLVVSCDLPFMDAPTLFRLIRERHYRPAGTLLTAYEEMESGRLEVLTAIYEPESLPWLETALNRNMYRLAAALPRCLRHQVPYGREEACPFYNLNVPADLETARRLAERL